jgi:hypothetical protein
VETIKLDGRNFHGVTEALAAIQDDYVLTQLQRSGVLGLLTHTTALSDEQREERAIETQARIVESGRKYKLLAGLLTEEGKTWTREDADKNAARFAAITDAEEKLIMGREVLRHVALFFRYETPSSQTFQSSSTQSDADHVTENAAPETLETSPSLSVP